MLDCGLSAHSVLNFLPLPPVPSTRLASLPNYTPPHLNDPLLEGVCNNFLFLKKYLLTSNITDQDQTNNCYIQQTT